MDRAVRRWADGLSPGLFDESTVTILIKKLSKTYTIYGSMLLVPPGSVDCNELRQIFDGSEGRSEVELYKHIAREMKITHIAINKPIPPSHAAGPDKAYSDNITRAPVDFQPVYGDFGPPECGVPLAETDYDQAYWVTAKQNGISQTWAPRWTMFSRGNISEKARLLELDSVAQAVREGQLQSTGCSVVDLYAGIGYFTFSYLKAGVNKALCWELNQWSCEGLRRGARANKWVTASHDGMSSLSELASGSQSLIIFNESNEHAVKRLEIMRPLLPPVRHVNCGLLPSSRASWLSAYQCLDPGYDGWIHLHENFAAPEIELQAERARSWFQQQMHADGAVAVVSLEHVNRVKTYAPGVFHCVVDLCIPRRGCN